MAGHFQRWKQRVTSDAGEKGATMLEYAIMAVLIAVVCVFAVSEIGPKVNNMIASVLPGLI